MVEIQYDSETLEAEFRDIGYMYSSLFLLLKEMLSTAGTQRTRFLKLGIQTWVDGLNPNLHNKFT